MDERVRSVARLLDGEKMAALCREFAISRKTGYKIFDRYKESGLEAASRQPFWPKSVTYVAGTFCHLCVRAGP
jgi:transposase